MNDLAEKALKGLDVARRQVRDRAMLSFAVAGLAFAVVIVVAGGAVGAANATRPLTSWLALQNTHTAPETDSVPAAIALGAILGLVLLWLAVIGFVRRSAQPAGRIWWVAAAWAAPFAIGPPLMDTSVYSYAAFGMLQRDGHDPYSAAPSRLGDLPVVTAIDPSARGTLSGVGPLGTLIQHLSMSIGRGSALAAVVLLRVLAVLVAIWIGRLAADMGGTRRDQALTLSVLNPLVLLYVVSAAHLDGLLVAFVLAALVAANQRRWWPAVAYACLAGSVTGQGFVVLPVIVAVHFFGRRGSPGWRIIGLDALVAAAVTCAVGFSVSGGFGWLATVSKQFAAHTPYSATGAVSLALTPIVRGASYDDLAIGGRITAITAMVCVVGYLIVTSRRRALERSAGYALLALGLLAPVLYPWYLLWGTLCLAPTANGARRIWVLGLCAAACVLNPPGFSTRVSAALTGALLLVIAVAVGCALVAQQRREAQLDADVLSAAG